MDHNTPRALETIRCDICNADFSKKKYSDHLISKRHLDRKYREEQKDQPINYLSQKITKIPLTSADKCNARSNKFHDLRSQIPQNRSNADFYWDNNWAEPLPTAHTRDIDVAIDETVRRFKLQEFQTLCYNLPLNIACNGFNWCVD